MACCSSRSWFWCSLVLSTWKSVVLISWERLRGRPTVPRKTGRLAGLSFLIVLLPFDFPAQGDGVPCYRDVDVIGIEDRNRHLDDDILVRDMEVGSREGALPAEQLWRDKTPLK